MKRIYKQKLYQLLFVEHLLCTSHCAEDCVFFSYLLFISGLWGRWGNFSSQKVLAPNCVSAKPIFFIPGVCPSDYICLLINFSEAQSHCKARSNHKSCCHSEFCAWDLNLRYFTPYVRISQLFTSLYCLVLDYIWYSWEITKVK